MAGSLGQQCQALAAFGARYIALFISCRGDIYRPNATSSSIIFPQPASHFASSALRRGLMTRLVRLRQATSAASRVLEYEGQRHRIETPQAPSGAALGEEVSLSPVRVRSGEREMSLSNKIFAQNFHLIVNASTQYGHPNGGDQICHV